MDAYMLLSVVLESVTCVWCSLVTGSAVDFIEISASGQAYAVRVLLTLLSRLERSQRAGGLLQ